MLAGNRYPLLGVTEKPDSPGREGSREVTNRIELISSLHGSHRCQHWQTAALLPGGLGRNLQPLVLLLGLLWSMSRGIHPYTRHTRTTFRFKGKMVTMTLYARQQKRHRCKEQTAGLYGRRRGWDDLREEHWNMYITICEIDDWCKFDAWSRALKASSLGQHRRMEWGGM